MKKATVIMVILSSILLWTTPLLAEEETPKKPWKRFNVDLGVSFLLNDSKVRIGGEGVGVEIDTEELLDLETNTTTFRLDGFWRFTKNLRHRLDFSWYTNRRSGEGTVDQELNIGDLPPIPVGASVETQFNFDLYRVGYSYSFFQDKRIDLGIGGGLYVLPVEFKLNATAESGGMTILDESVKETFAAPLPVIGIRADIAITPRWFLRNRADFFYLEIGDYRGAIVDTRLAVEYQPFKHVGFGLAWDNFRLAAEAKDDNTGIPGTSFKGTYQFRNAGMMVYLKANF